MGVVEDYVRLAFQLAKHIDGLVDSYYGPAELRQEAEGASPMQPADISAWAQDLKRKATGEIPDPNRRHFLAKQLDALAAQADRLAGHRLPYLEYVGLLFDVTPVRVEEAEIARLHEQVVRLLEQIGYRGDPAEAVLRWEEDNRIPKDQVVPEIEQMAEQARLEARRIAPLPEREGVTVIGVPNQPWSAYNWFLGGYRSRIEINLDVPISVLHARHLVHHEMYPGHHTDHSCHEAICYHQKGLLEPSIELINTPRSAVVEGLANTCALFVQESERMPEEKLYDAVSDLRGAVGVNTAIMVHQEGAAFEEALQYRQKAAILTRARAEQAMKFIMHPLWSPYIFTYWIGAQIIKKLWASAQRSGKQRQLIDLLYTEMLVPSLLVKRARELGI